MKHLFLVISLVFFAFACFSQSKVAKMTMKGVVVDSLAQTALGYATLTVRKRTGNQLSRTAYTNPEGEFELAKLPLGDYDLFVTLVGYKPLQIHISKTSSGPDHEINLGKISMSALQNDLKTVSVNGYKPLVVQQADRLSYDVQADPESKSSNALDMLRKVPLVSVDGADNIHLKGSSNYRMLVNGKTSSMVAKNPSDLLKGMPADNIERIEVITTPPAKYDAEGISGIINIITHRTLSEGYSVSLTSTYNTVNGTSANINLKTKSGKFGVQGFLGTAQPVEQTVAIGYSNKTTGSLGAQISQNGVRVHDRDNSFASAQFSFEADSLNLFTADLEFHNGGSSQQMQQASDLFDQQMRLSQSYELLNGITNQLRGTDVGFNHEYAISRSKGQLLTSSYKYSYSRDAFSNHSTYSNTVNYTSPDFLQRNKSGSKEHTLQVDYVHPLRAIRIEMGAKAVLRNNFSEFDTRTADGQGAIYELDLDQSNSFDYRQHIYSLYNSYHAAWHNWDAAVGLRLERSSVNADFNLVDGRVTQRYTNLFPSLSVQRKLPGANSISLGYQERLERPGIVLLNPFEDYTNPRFLKSGNPDLEAVLNHTIDLIYSNHSRSPFILGFSYAFANNTIEQFTEVSEDQISRTSYQNVGRKRATSLILNSSFSITPKLNTNIDGQIMHVGLTGSVDGRLYSNNGYQGHLFSNTRYTFKKGYRLGVDVSYDSRYVLLQGRDNDFLYYSINGSRNFSNNKATLSVSTSNFFNKYTRLDFITRGSSFNQRSFYDIYYRRFNIRLLYKFGRLKADLKKNQRGIHNDDQTRGRSNPS